MRMFVVFMAIKCSFFGCKIVSSKHINMRIVATKRCKKLIFGKFCVKKLVKSFHQQVTIETF